MMTIAVPQQPPTSQRDLMTASTIAAPSMDECIAEAAGDFSEDLVHHLGWLKERRAGADIEEAKRLRGILDGYIAEAA